MQASPRRSSGEPFGGVVAVGAVGIQLDEQARCGPRRRPAASIRPGPGPTFTFTRAYPSSDRAPGRRPAGTTAGQPEDRAAGRTLHPATPSSSANEVRARPQVGVAHRHLEGGGGERVTGGTGAVRRPFPPGPGGRRADRVPTSSGRSTRSRSLERCPLLPRVVGGVGQRGTLAPPVDRPPVGTAAPAGRGPADGTGGCPPTWRPGRGRAAPRGAARPTRASTRRWCPGPPRPVAGDPGDAVPTGRPWGRAYGRRRSGPADGSIRPRLPALASCGMPTAIQPDVAVDAGSDHREGAVPPDRPDGRRHGAAVRIVCHLAAEVPLVVLCLRSMATGSRATSDDAVAAWRAWDVLSAHPTLLRGADAYDRVGPPGLAPGPVLSWLLAVPVTSTPPRAPCGLHPDRTGRGRPGCRGGVGRRRPLGAAWDRRRRSRSSPRRRRYS